MSLTLTVDGDRWRAHLRSVAGSQPGLVPVAKGNGYGFGLARLARKAGWLGVDTLAVGTYDELPEVASRYDGDLLVLTPWRPFGAAVELADPLQRICVPNCDECEVCNPNLGSHGACRAAPDLSTCGPNGDQICCSRVCQPSGVETC